jgi:hypothetical protein
MHAIVEGTGVDRMYRKVRRLFDGLLAQPGSAGSRVCVLALPTRATNRLIRSCVN